MKQFFYLFTVFLLFFSCNFESYQYVQKVSFSAKDIDSLQTEKKILKILFIDAENQIREYYFPEVANTKEDNSFTLPLVQNQLTPILVFFEDFLEPWGTIYPFSTEISYKKGFAGKILFRLLNETKSTNPKLLKKYFSYFNWQRFLEAVNNYENPWMLNQEIILEGISQKSFTSKCFQLLQLE